MIRIDWIVWIVNKRPVGIKNLHLCKKWLTRFSLPPVGAIEKVFAKEIKIFLPRFRQIQGAAICTKVSCLFEVGCYRTNP